MNYKLRIKHPSGAEFEAEGTPEFVLTEKEGFLSRLTTAPENHTDVKESPADLRDTLWESLTETKNGLLILKNKHHELRAEDAALLLLAAARLLSKKGSVQAIALSKAIKTSGYAPGRLDRLLAKADREGLAKASGTKRNRAYQATDKGLERAWLEARKLQ